MMTQRLMAFGLAFLALAAPVAAAAGVMRYIHPPPESSLDRRYVYHWKILETALEKTKATWGPYEIGSSVLMTEKRQAYEIRNATGKLTVMYLSTVPEFEHDLIPVRIPVDKNLGGYCVFLIRKGEEARFAGVKTIEDLRRFTFGLGFGWIDVDILRANGLKVVTGSSYDGLFEMLANGRFDVFLRAVPEVLDEYGQRRRAMPDLAIEPSLALYYPLPMYFWFPKTPEGRRLAERAREGMMKMLGDGSFDRIFAEFQAWKIRRLNLKGRRIISIRNPFLGPETPFADKRLWFDPETYEEPK